MMVSYQLLIVVTGSISASEFFWLRGFTVLLLLLCRATTLLLTREVICVVTMLRAKLWVVAMWWSVAMEVGPVLTTGSGLMMKSEIILGNIH